MDFSAPLNSFDTKLPIFFVMIMSAAILLLGPKAFSLDACLFDRREIIKLAFFRDDNETSLAAAALQSVHYLGANRTGSMAA